MKTPDELLLKALIKKLGEEKLVGLLSGEMDIAPKSEDVKRTTYVRDCWELKTPFTECDGHEIDVDLVLYALDDACNNMSYSNWTTDKLARAGECVLRYCEEHDIPVTYKKRNL